MSNFMVFLYLLAFKNFMLNSVECEKSFITLGAGCPKIHKILKKFASGSHWFKHTGITLKYLSIGTPNTTTFPFVPNEK